MGSAPGLGALHALTALEVSPGADWGPLTPLSLTQLTQLSSCHLVSNATGSVILQLLRLN